MTTYKLARAACIISIAINMIANNPGWAIFFLLVLRFWFSDK
jgi:hypothetical protein